MLVTLEEITKLSLHWLGMTVFIQRKIVNDLLFRARIVVRTSTRKTSRRVVWQTTPKNCTKTRAARVARVFFLIQPIVSLICDVVVAHCRRSFINSRLTWLNLSWVDYFVVFWSKRDKTKLEESKASVAQNFPSALCLCLIPRIFSRKAVFLKQKKNKYKKKKKNST